MKTLFLAVAITALSVGQPAGGPLAGSWTAKFEGRTFIRLEIKTVDGAIAGGISLGHFEVDPQGLVRRADAAPAAFHAYLRFDEERIDRDFLRERRGRHGQIRVAVARKCRR